MALDYNQDELQIKDLDPVVDEYTDWFMQVVRRLFFALDKQEGLVFADPQSFRVWLKEAQGQKSIPDDVLSGLGRLHDDLKKMADQMIQETIQLQRSPVYKDFDQLATFFEEFVHALRRLARDHKSGETGVDALTGLRNYEYFSKDIRREMDRLARQGKAFSLALVRIDRLDEIQKTASQQDFENCLRLVAAMVKKTVRSFDDAYRTDTNEFILSLKQTTSSGGMKALHRLKAELEKHRMTFKLKSGVMPLTLSSCIAEPLPEDDVRQVLRNMTADLDRHAGEDGFIMEYLEMSPLQRFISEGRE